MNNYGTLSKNCEICQIIGGRKKGIHNEIYLVELKGGWILNHCHSSNTYLGYLILSTKKHKINFNVLSSDELNSLGFNIKWINQYLTKYWSLYYKDDPIEQIYVAYFNEAPYIRNLIGQELLEQLHVHVHILPRTKKMRTIDNTRLGWDLLKIVDQFPDHYIHDDKSKVKLMTFLKSQPIS